MGKVMNALMADQGCGNPNIIIMLIDDMGWKDAGFMGSTYYETPNMDRLAASGMIFQNAYANPNCAPTRASLMTGLYTPRHGIFTVGTSERGAAHLRKLIPPVNQTILGVEHTTIAEMLKQSDYVCGHVGKWHLGNGAVTGPEGRGFDLNVAGCNKGLPPSYFSPYKIPTLPDGPDNEYLTDRLTDEAVRFIEDNREKPFFLYFAHYAVHTPLQAKEELVEKYRKKEGSNGQNHPIYAAMVDSTDQSVGRVLDKLKELAILDNTVIILLSDNGGIGGYLATGVIAKEHTSQAPLRGGKGMLYEGGIRVPMIVSWPSVIPAGTESDVPVSVIDLFPTIQEMAGNRDFPSERLDGESLMPLLNGTGKLRRETIFWHFPTYLHGTEGTYSFRCKMGSALRHNEWKLIECLEDNSVELYNLETDIGEQHNLAAEMLEKTRELHQLLISWRESVNAPMPLEPNPEYTG
jgi:arylsulfatase A-like enzyme